MFLRVLYCLQILVLINLISFSRTVDSGSDLNKARLPTIYYAMVDAHSAMISLFSVAIGTELTTKKAHLGNLSSAIVNVWSRQIRHKRIATMVLNMLLFDRLYRSAADLSRIGDRRI